MKTASSLHFPNNLEALLREVPEFETDDFAPIAIEVLGELLTGDPVLQYQLAFEAGVDFEEAEAIMEECGMGSLGYDWEELIRRCIRKNDPQLQRRVFSDSEGSTCVLYTRNEADFRKLLAVVLHLTQSPALIRKYAKGTWSMRAMHFFRRLFRKNASDED